MHIPWSFVERLHVTPAKPAVRNKQFQHIFDMGVLGWQLQQIIVTVMPNSGTKLQQPGLNKGIESRSTGPVHGIVLIDAGVF